MPIPILKTLAKKSKKSEEYVESLWNEISKNLLKQGMKEDDKRFYPYLMTILKRKLSINEKSLILKRFKDFLNERQV